MKQPRDKHLRPAAAAVPVAVVAIGAAAVIGVLRCGRAREHAAPTSTPTTLRALYGIAAPTSLDARRTALLLVDFQQEFFIGKLPIPDAPRAVERAAELLGWARASGLAVVHVRNVSARQDSPLFAPGGAMIEIVPELAPAPGETVVIKAAAGGFSRTDLDASLRGRGVDTLVVGGLMTHLAVDTTVRDAMVLGYRVVVAADATATRDLPGTNGSPAVDRATLQRAALAALADRFADVMSSRGITSLPVLR